MSEHENIPTPGPGIKFPEALENAHRNTARFLVEQLVNEMPDDELLKSNEGFARLIVDITQRNGMQLTNKDDKNYHLHASFPDAKALIVTYFQECLEIETEEKIFNLEKYNKLTPLGITSIIEYYGLLGRTKKIVDIANENLISDTTVSRSIHTSLEKFNRAGIVKGFFDKEPEDKEQLLKIKNQYISREQKSDLQNTLFSLNISYQLLSRLVNYINDNHHYADFTDDIKNLVVLLNADLHDPHSDAPLSPEEKVIILAAIEKLRNLN